MRTGHTDEQYRLVRPGVDRMVQDRFRDYKYKVHKHFKNKGANAQHKDLSAEDWKKCVELYTSPKNLVSIQLNYYSSYNFFYLF